MATKTKKLFLPNTREFCTPEDFRDRTFVDAFADVFTPPEDLTLHQADNAFMARIRAGTRIRKYFDKAVDQELNVNGDC